MMKQSDFWTKLAEILIRQAEQQMSESKNSYTDPEVSSRKPESSVSNMNKNANTVTYHPRSTSR